MVAITVGLGPRQRDGRSAQRGRREASLVRVARVVMHHGAYLVERDHARRIDTDREHDVARQSIGCVRALTAHHHARFHSQEHVVAAGRLHQT